VHNAHNLKHSEPGKACGYTRKAGDKDFGCVLGLDAI